MGPVPLQSQDEQLLQEKLQNKIQAWSCTAPEWAILSSEPYYIQSQGLDMHHYAQRTSADFFSWGDSEICHLF